LSRYVGGRLARWHNRSSEGGTATLSTTTGMQVNGDVNIHGTNTDDALGKLRSQQDTGMIMMMYGAR
jgi:hypothetical protein